MQKLDYVSIGMRIRKARKEKGLSQDRLAKKCGICLSYMVHIERGTRCMSLETFANICKILDAEADSILWGTKRLPDAVLDMWNLPGKDRKGRGSQDKKQDKKNLHKGGRAESDGQSPGEETGYGTDSGKPDSYAMYVRIMKSVAEIMNEA